ncbi:MAG: radical SAM protein [Planctomycetaceae bacterium]|nr:radical SAM protein [Planctomycetaceae bacterium]
MIWPWGSRRPVRVGSFVFEATRACNHSCLHCYNFWRGQIEAGPELDTVDTLVMLDRMIAQTGARLVTISGGEPLLRKDIFEIVDHLAGRKIAVNFLTNGTLLDEAAIECLGGGKVSLFELPLLSVQREVHDRLSGSPGAFDKLTLAIARLKSAAQRVVCVFVATRVNLPTWEQTIELAVALGADGIMFNRFNPGGAAVGLGNIEQLQASPEELSAAMDIANAAVEKYHIGISCSIPMPQCLFDHARWPRLSFGYCAAGTARAYYTLDALGNVRPCNHSPTVLGNIRTQTFKEMVQGAAMDAFAGARPPFCGGCKMELTCQGGCKASAELCGGDLSGCDPFLAAFSHQARKL